MTSISGFAPASVIGGNHERVFPALDHLDRSLCRFHHDRQQGLGTFRNPTRKEYQEALAEHAMVRAFLVGDDIFVWNVFGAVHRSIRDFMKLHETIIPLVIFGKPGQRCVAEVTDHVQNTMWSHNAAVAAAIQNHPYMRRMFTKVTVQYYDEDIVGDWQKLAEGLYDRRMPSVLYHGTSTDRLEYIAGDGLRPALGAAGVSLTDRLIAEDYVNNCVPWALHKVSGMPYDAVHRVCAKHGWTPKGMKWHQQHRAMQELGIQIKPTFNQHLIGQPLSVFLRYIDPTKTFLVDVERHTTVVQNGRVLDDVGLRHKVRMYNRVLYPGDDPNESDTIRPVGRDTVRPMKEAMQSDDVRAVPFEAPDPITAETMTNYRIIRGDEQVGVVAGRFAKTAEEAIAAYRRRGASDWWSVARTPPREPRPPPKSVSRFELVDPADIDSSDDADDFYYHVTTRPRSVLRVGLRPNRKPTMDTGFYRNYAAGKVFFCERPGVPYWLDKIGHHLEAQYERPPKLAVVRFAKSMVAQPETDALGTRDSTEPSYFVTHGIR